MSAGKKPENGIEKQVHLNEDGLFSQKKKFLGF